MRSISCARFLQEDLEEEDVLENTRVAQLKKREDALKAAKKTTAFEAPDDSWEKKTVLGKYDEKKEEGIKLDEQGAIDAAKRAKQEEIKRRLAVAAGGGVAALAGKEESADVTADGKAQADFYTAAEMEQARAGTRFSFSFLLPFRCCLSLSPPLRTRTHPALGANAHLSPARSSTSPRSCARRRRAARRTTSTLPSSRRS